LIYFVKKFNNIHGYEDIKDIVRRALDAEDNYNLLFVGPSASAKTLFLLGILKSKSGVYFDGSNTTNRILDVLQEKRPKIIRIDELDKMPRQFQDKLLNFMESGHIKVDQMRKQYDFKIEGAKVFAACNEIIRLSRPLQSRFRRLHLPSYTEEQFLEVSVKALPKLKIAHVIEKAVSVASPTHFMTFFNNFHAASALNKGGKIDRRLEEAAFIVEYIIGAAV
jgi:MoxR-like ATPase